MSIKSLQDNTIEGVVKYQCHLHQSAVPVFVETKAVRAWESLCNLREWLFAQGWIGVNEWGMGYGNTSMRMPHDNEDTKSLFLISGTGTGAKSPLVWNDYPHILRADIAHNSVWACGTIAPSSEALSHAALYAAHPSIVCVVHIHHAGLFELLGNTRSFHNLSIDHTATQSAYGTAELANALAVCVRARWTSPHDRAYGTVVSLGHEDGIFFYSFDIEYLSHMLQTLRSAV